MVMLKSVGYARSIKEVAKIQKKKTKHDFGNSFDLGHQKGVILPKSVYECNVMAI